MESIVAHSRFPSVYSLTISDAQIDNDNVISNGRGLFFGPCRVESSVERETFYRTFNPFGNALRTKLEMLCKQNDNQRKNALVLVGCNFSKPSTVVSIPEVKTMGMVTAVSITGTYLLLVDLPFEKNE